MKLAFIISGYKRPDLLVRLVRVLEGRPCAIHIDAKSPIFEEVVEALRDVPNVHYLPRQKVNYPMFGLVEPTLKGLRWLQTTDCDYALLLTGQCYPLRTIESIERCLPALNGISIIDYHSLPFAYWAKENGGWSRIDRFYVRIFGRIRSFKLWRRQLPYGLDAYCGAAECCLSRAAGDYILDYIDKRPDFVRFFRSVFAPDEMFFQTILANSPLRNSLINDTPHYIEWESDETSPRILTSVDELFASSKWFARKFDDHAVLDAIDERRTKNSDPANSIAPVPLSADGMTWPFYPDRKHDGAASPLPLTPTIAKGDPWFLSRIFAF